VQKNNRPAGVSTQAQDIPAEDHFLEDFHLGIKDLWESCATSKHATSSPRYWATGGNWPNTIPARTAPLSGDEN